MKIRSDFVTNSSSSSYITVQVQNKVLYALLRNYEDELQLDTVSPSVIKLVPFGQEADVDYDTTVPANYEEAIAKVWKSLDYHAQECPELHNKLLEAKADIDACYEKMLFVVGYEEWGGDGDLRYEWPLPEEDLLDGAGEEGVYYYSADLAAGSASETSGYTYYPLSESCNYVIDEFGDSIPDNPDFEGKDLTVSKADINEIIKKYKVDDFITLNGSF